MPGSKPAQPPLATETSLNVPVEWINKGQGVAIDIGCDVTHVLYQPRSQLQQWKMKFEGASHGRVKMFSFETKNINKIVDYLITNASVKGKNEEVEEDDAEEIEKSTTIYITGYKAKEFQEKLAGDLEVKIEVVPEETCTIAAFKTLVNNFSKGQVVHDCLTDVEEASRLLVEELRNPGKPKPAKVEEPPKEDTNDAKPEETPKDVTPPPTPTTPVTPTLPKLVLPPYAATDKDIFPCMLAIMGEATRYVKIEQDGTFKELDVNIGLGHATGLTSLILKTRTFKEAVELAASGDETQLNVMGKDVTELTSPVPDDLVCQPLAKAAGFDVGKFKREDLAAAVIGDVASRITSMVHTVMQSQGVKKIYFCGDMVSHQLVRQQFARWLSFGAALTQKPVEWYFVKEADYLGVLGAYTYHLSKK